MTNLLAKFGGKIFRKVGKAKNKTLANVRAKGIRRRGGNARVVKAKKGYDIFKRGGKSKKRR